MCFLPFPGPSSSGDQVLGKCTVPGGPCILITSPVLATCFHRCAGRAPPQVCHVSPLGSWSQATSPLADVSCTGSQEDVVSNWEPAHILVKDAGLWGWDWSSPLPSSSGCHTPTSLSLMAGSGLYAADQLSFGIHSILCSVTRLWIRAFHGKVFFFFPLSLWWSLSLGCYLMLAPSDCPQGIQAQSLPWGLIL